MSKSKKIIAYYNDYFLSKLYFDKLENVESHNSNELKNSLVDKVINGYLKKINTLFYFVVFLFPSTYERKDRDVLLLFAITNIFDTLYIINKHRKCQVVVWIWNKRKQKKSISKSIYFLYLKVIKAKVITFDGNDADKYGIDFYPQVYNENILDDEQLGNESQVDVSFVGADKGRYNKIIDISRILEDKGVSLSVKVISDRNSPKKGRYLQEKLISYEDNLKTLYDSKCILDINVIEQSGLTVRLIEALFANRKVITDNSNVMDYDIYNSNNIFILGVDDYERLNEFIDTPFDASNLDELKKHRLDAFIDSLVS